MKRVITPLIFVGLFLFPILANGSLYYAGGDDMRLYYLFPDKYLKNYVFNLIAGNTLAGANTGYATVAYYAPMFYFIKLLKIIPLNTQFLMYGLNLSFGFLFFYKFLGLYIKKDIWFVKVCASFFYVLSPFLIATYYRNQMLSMYLVSIIPACFYYFIRGVRENKYYFTFASALIFSIFSTVVNTLPWWSSFLISSLFILIYEFISRKLPYIKHTFILVLSFLVINTYWLIHFVRSQIDGGGLKAILGNYSSSGFLADNFRVMTGVSRLFSPLNVIFNSPQVIFKEDLSLITFLNISFFVLIFAAFLFIKKVNDKTGTIYILFLISFLISWFLFSPNLGNWGPKTFLLMGRKIPFFTMYRNMFDKFSLSLAFFFAGSLALSLSIVSEKLSQKITVIVCCFLMLLTVVNARDFLLFRYTFNQQISRISGVFNDDYELLISFFMNMENKSKVLWLPLNFPTYANIEDKNTPGHYYSGLSPLRILADRSDYAGKFSFITETDYFVGDRLFEYLEKGDYYNAGLLFQQRNAKYIVVDKQVLHETMQPYLYGGEGKLLLKYQNGEFFENILGTKIKSFGNRYELYNINQRFDSDLIYITDNSDGEYQSNNRLRYTKINTHEYVIFIKDLKPEDNLVFLESFNKNWKLNMVDNEKTSEISPLHEPVFGYANVWALGKITGERNSLKFILRFDSGTFDL